MCNGILFISLQNFEEYLVFSFSILLVHPVILLHDSIGAYWISGSKTSKVNSMNINNRFWLYYSWLWEKLTVQVNILWQMRYYIVHKTQFYVSLVYVAMIEKILQSRKQNLPQELTECIVYISLCSSLTILLVWIESGTSSLLTHCWRILINMRKVTR